MLQRNIKAAMIALIHLEWRKKNVNLIAGTFGTEEVLETQFYHAKEKKC